jgi:hypothetical protein
LTGTTPSTASSAWASAMPTSPPTRSPPRDPTASSSSASTTPRHGRDPGRGGQLWAGTAGWSSPTTWGSTPAASVRRHQRPGAFGHHHLRRGPRHRKLLRRPAAHAVRHRQPGRPEGHLQGQQWRVQRNDPRDRTDHRRKRQGDGGCVPTTTAW